MNSYSGLSTARCLLLRAYASEIQTRSGETMLEVREQARVLGGSIVGFSRMSGVLEQKGL